jgi:hypothetical protein
MTDAPLKDEFRFPCPSCKANAVFNPTVSALECPFCGWRENVPRSVTEIQEQDLSSRLNEAVLPSTTPESATKESVCNGCGYRVTFSEGEVASSCPFCAQPVVIQQSSTDALITPQAVLPFGITKQEATRHLKSWISGLWFAPNRLKDFVLLGEINGVYLPFWTYDAFTLSPYHGERGDYYYVNESYTTTDSQGQRVTKTRQVRKTRWHSVSGEVSRFFNDTLAPGVSSLSQPKLVALEPWDLDKIASYDPSYLAGFKALRYQISVKEGFAFARQRMEQIIYEDIRRDIGGDEQRIHGKDTAYSALTFKHILLPVYVGAFRFQERVFQILVNARTGEVQGERPYSVIKIILASIGAMVVIGLVLYLYLSVYSQSGRYQ